jgi:hypothetical protein
MYVPLMYLIRNHQINIYFTFYFNISSIIVLQWAGEKDYDKKYTPNVFEQKISCLWFILSSLQFGTT